MCTSLGTIRSDFNRKKIHKNSFIFQPKSADRHPSAGEAWKRRQIYAKLSRLRSRLYRHKNLQINYGAKELAESDVCALVFKRSEAISIETTSFIFSENPAKSADRHPSAGEAWKPRQISTQKGSFSARSKRKFASKIL